MTVGLRFSKIAGAVGVAALGIASVGGGCSQSREPEPEGLRGETRAALVIATPGFNETTVIGGLQNPTVLRFAHDGRVFVAEKGGKIWVYDSLSDSTPSLFVDLADRVHDFWDRGLLGLALHPQFPTEPYVYVLYTYDGDPGGPPGKWGDRCPSPPGANADGCVVSARLSRLRAIGDVAGTETVLLEGWRQQYPSHSIGQLEFGPDGALYASGGDGASFDFVDYGQDGAPLNPLGDPPVPVGAAQTPPDAEGGALRSQSPRRAGGTALLNGTVIRIDPATGAGLPDNPGAGSSDANLQRVIAYGLRNPYRFTSRPGKSELWVADVGWNGWEELNRITLGGATAPNFGWPCYEGPDKQAGYDGAGLAQCESLYASDGHTSPYFAYAHSGGVSASDGCGRGTSAVTGVAFYSGGTYPPSYDGALFFADYSRRCIYVMSEGASGDPDPTTARSFHVAAEDPVYLTTGPGGDLFYAAFTAGTIQRISYRQPTASFSATPTQGPVPLLVSFDASASIAANPTDVLRYAWDLDGDGEFDDATDLEPSYLYDEVGSYAARLKVTDQRGGFGISPPITIKATEKGTPLSTPPEVFIDTPTSGGGWKVGDEIAFSGHAVDAEDGVLPASALSWQVVIQHCPSGCHVHDLLSFEGVASGSFNTEDHEYPMYMELILTATDSSGDQRTARLPLHPATVSLVFDTQPSGLELVVGATEQTTPFARRVIVGSQNSVSAAALQTASGTHFSFTAWSDGLPRAHALAPATAPHRYVATYAAGGLTGRYYDQLGFAGAPVLVRLDPVIDFDWGMGAPDVSIDINTFSVRWTGEIKADFAEEYTFMTTSDDGVRLRIGGATIIDHFDNHSATVDTGKVMLSAGWHPIVLEYFENTVNALIDLSWSSPSQPAGLVPASHLRPSCISGVCPGDLTCNASNLCVPACDPALCGGATQCPLSGATCVSSCAGLACPVGDKCRDGACIDACSDVSCPVAQHCEAGACVDDPVLGAGGAGGAAAAGAAGADGAGAGGRPSDVDGGSPGIEHGGSPSNDGGNGGAPSAENGGAGGHPPNSGGASGTAGASGSGGASASAGSSASAGEPATDPNPQGGAPEPGPSPAGGKGDDPEGGSPNTGPTSGRGGVPGAASGSAGSGSQDVGGCACKATGGASPGPTGVGLLGLGLTGLVLRRRRSRPTR